MKKIGFIFLCSISVYVLTGYILERFNAGIHLHFEKRVTNVSDTPIGLYPENALKRDKVSTLAPGEALPFAYSGKSGSWKYAVLNERVVSVRSDHAWLEYHIVGRYVPERLVDKVHNYSLVFSLFLLFLMTVMKVLPKRERKRANNNNPYLHEITHQKEQLALKNTENHELREKLKAQVYQHRVRENKNAENKKHEIERLKKELKKIVLIESETRHQAQASISEMKCSYDRLSDKYKRVIDEAREFGVDFNDPIYERLLKGRRYELCVARSLVVDEQFKILEWTPDKGFDSGIKVESNTNPDLILQDASDNVIAIECKYRSTYYYKSHNKEISWASFSQVERYKTFSEKREMSVWIALGFDGAIEGGNPRSPEHNYLVALGKICTDSRYDDPDRKGRQAVVKQSDIYNDFVRKGDYAAYLQAVLYAA